MAHGRDWAAADTRRVLRIPTAGDDKYSRGVVGIRTGSAEYPGAAVLGVEAAWRAGAGFVRYIGAGRAADAVIARRPETVAAPAIGRSHVDAWVIGSGTDASRRTAEDEQELRLILSGTAPVVVDAGALDLAIGAAAPCILTPHAGEHARLRARLGLPEPGDDRAADAAQTAAALDAVVLLKGAPTLSASPYGAVLRVDTAPHWLATAGAGDVLAGVIGALAAADPHALPAATAAGAAWLHGRAAALAAGTAHGGAGRPIVALDVAASLPAAIGELLS